MGTVVILVLVGLGVLAAGFLMGRYYVPDDRVLKRQARRAQVYVRTVNELLAGDLDGAEGALKELVESESVEDIEPYFALGALFRRKGRWEAAVRVHQAIKLREGQSKRTRVRAHYELGLDFCRAGMPRKATRAMNECLADDSKHEGALRALCLLYEEQGRYADAADAWRRLARLCHEEPPERLHHLLVAAAQQALERGDTDSAKRSLREARREGESVQALWVGAELARATGRWKRATERLEQALALEPELARVLVPDLVAVQRELAAPEVQCAAKNESTAEATPEVTPRATMDGKPEDQSYDRRLDREARKRAVAVLERVLEATGPSAHIELAMAELRSHDDPSAALADYRRTAAEFATLLPARLAAARLALASGKAGEVQAELAALVARGGILSWAMDGAWRCGHCGQSSDEFFWRCTRCRVWGRARLDVGRDVLDVPRPRRARAALRGGVDTALAGAAAHRALPEPTLDSGLGDEELAEAGRRPSVLGRVGDWFASTWSGMRGERAQGAQSSTRALPPRADAAATEAGAPARTGSSRHAAMSEGVAPGVPALPGPRPQAAVGQAAEPDGHVSGPDPEDKPASELAVRERAASQQEPR